MKRPLFLLFYLYAPLSASIPLLVLKQGRSGSSWFTYLLNRLDRVYITEELFGRKDAKFVRLTKTINTTAYVAESFQHPMLKFPRGEDMTKRNMSYDIIGSTFCPKHSSVKFDVLARMVPNLRVVSFLRSNIVKHVISWIRGWKLSRKCHAEVINGNCRLDGKTMVDPSTFSRLLVEIIAQDQYSSEVARLLATNLESDFRLVLYEDILGFEDEIDKLIEWIGLDIHDFTFTSKMNTRCTENCTKTTSDDLRNVIANYEEIESLINSKYSCLRSQFYETRPGKVQPPVGNICGDLFTNSVASIKKTYES